MISTSNRLQKKTDFDLVYRKGRSFYLENISLKILPNDKEATRVGFSIGLKFSKSAVKRNRIKRQLREIFRLNLAKLTPGIDIVVMAKKKEPDQTYQELEEIIEKLFWKANLIKNAKSEYRKMKQS